MPRIPVNIADHVGRTPMVQLTRLVPEGVDVQLFGKLEAFNPGGSVKDRIGVAMIEAAGAEGRIEPGRTTIVEATSGNTGIALAFCCAAKGYGLTIFLPQGMSREREALLRLYGARVELVESLGGMNEAVDAARAAAQDDDVFLPAVLDTDLLDEVIACSDDDAIDLAHQAAAREGILAGVSRGAALWGALQVAQRPESKGKRIVTVLPDSGERYISAPFFAPRVDQAAAG